MKMQPIGFRTVSSEKCKGFTLVELLVVIAIIIVLLAILLPSLASARESARTIYCLSNLKSMGQASTIYSHENDGWYVPVSVDIGGWPNIMVWASNLAFREIIGAPTQVSVTQGIYSDFHTVPARLLCKNAAVALERPYVNTADPEDPNNGFFEWGLSYGMNAHIDNAGANGDYTGLYNNPGNFPAGKVCGVKSSAVIDPAHKVMFLDSIGQMTHAWTSALYRGEDPSLGYFIAAYRHRNNDPTSNQAAANVAFYDGHAETVSRSLLDIDRNLSSHRPDGNYYKIHHPYWTITVE